jgi:hypothetical protein
MQTFVCNLRGTLTLLGLGRIGGSQTGCYPDVLIHPSHPAMHLTNTPLHPPHLDCVV